MSRIVKHNGIVYLCEQVCKDSTRGIEDQTKSTLEKVDARLEQAGSDRKHILSAAEPVTNMHL
jgi:enamine deaminase RidA (YjgF/YER057c/UK114 family)